MSSFEALALTINFKSFSFNGNLMFNILNFFEFNLILLHFRIISKEKITNKVVSLILVLFNISFIFSTIILGEGNLYEFNGIISAVGALLTSVVLVLYLREFLLSDELLNYSKNINFWITVGLLFYYLGTMPLMGAFNIINETGVFLGLYVIQSILTITMHFFFIFGILWSLRKIT
jgi:hypothetical protein